MNKSPISQLSTLSQEYMELQREDFSVHYDYGFHKHFSGLTLDSKDPKWFSQSLYPKDTISQ